ncbi:MAG: response regulator [Deltaproteobacteria bacterium]|nr:response regulator [Deltaproteobacteria bacterium]
MTSNSPLKDKMVLVVDDEPDVLETVKEELDMCLVHTAKDYETALQYLLSYTYDIVILDIMGVNGFELLKNSVSRGFPTVMLTAHALTPEALKKSIKLGAVTVMGEGKPGWKKLFDRMGSYFNKRFGPDWKEKDKFFQDFEEELKREEAG